MFYDTDETLYTSEYKVSMLVRLRACEVSTSGVRTDGQ